MYTVVILDYCLAEVRVYHFSKFNKPKDPEAWIKEHDKNWSDAQCYWMGGEDMSIKYMDRDTGECLAEELA